MILTLHTSTEQPAHSLRIILKLHFAHENNFTNYSGLGLSLLRFCEGNIWKYLQHGPAN